MANTNIFGYGEEPIIYNINSLAFRLARRVSYYRVKDNPRRPVILSFPDGKVVYSEESSEEELERKIVKEDSKGSLESLGDL